MAEPRSVDVDRQSSKRTGEHEAMLQEAISQPGVHEAFEIYLDWQKLDSRLDVCRRSMAPPTSGVSTDRTAHG